MRRVAARAAWPPRRCVDLSVRAWRLSRARAKAPHRDEGPRARHVRGDGSRVPASPAGLRRRPGAACPRASSVDAVEPARSPRAKGLIRRAHSAFDGRRLEIHLTARRGRSRQRSPRTSSATSKTSSRSSRRPASGAAPSLCSPRASRSPVRAVSSTSDSSPTSVRNRSPNSEDPAGRKWFPAAFDIGRSPGAGRGGAGSASRRGAGPRRFGRARQPRGSGMSMPSRRSSSRFSRGGRGASRTRRRRSRRASRPPAMTRWHGTMIPIGLRATAPPTARAAPGRSTAGRSGRSSRPRPTARRRPPRRTAWSQAGRSDRSIGRSNARRRPARNASSWATASSRTACGVARRPRVGAAARGARRTARAGSGLAGDDAAIPGRGEVDGPPRGVDRGDMDRSCMRVSVATSRSELAGVAGILPGSMTETTASCRCARHRGHPSRSRA